MAARHQDSPLPVRERAVGMSYSTYLDEGRDRDALSAFPLESTFRGVPFDRVVARLRTERSLFDGGVVANDPSAPWLTAIVLAEREGDAALQDTLTSLALQSCPHVRCIVIPSLGVDVAALNKFVERSSMRPKATEVCADLTSENRLKLRKARYVTFLRHGDVLHPAAAAWLGCHATSAGADSADVVAWGELQPSATGGIVWAQRNPALQRETLLHYPYLRNAFAVSSRFVVAYPGDLADEIKFNALHLFQIWLAHQGELRWFAHPEYFLLRAADRASETPDKAGRMAYAEYGQAYAKLIKDLVGGLLLVENAVDFPAPYKLVPKEVPAVVSAVILFRDKPELTLRAIASIASQSYRGFLEVILVNNQSREESVAEVKAGIAKLTGAISTCRIINFDKPFNHSRQCNIAVEGSLGEVVVLLNNDCELLSTNALTEMSAWAVRPGVASVGLCIRDPSTLTEASGIEARLAPINYFDSIVEERSGAAFIPFVRECFGNTFACVAIPRVVFDRVGGLDAVRFPNGYNDVDFVCRTRGLGLKHVTLGHLKATHTPGQSRDRTDESPQKILIRELYSYAVGGLGQLAFDEGLARMATKKAEAAKLKNKTKAASPT
jgi:GT2 family glycosyltransferase